MHISVIASSQRSNSQSLRVSRFLAGRIAVAGGTAEILDLHELALSTDIDQVGDSRTAEPMVERLELSDGAVFVTPEWHGMPSPGLLNFLLHIGTSLAHKPVLLVGVSSGRGGSYPIAALRASGYKNAKYLMIPEHLIFRNVKEMVVGEEPAGPDDDHLRRRSDFAVATLLAYARGMTDVRRALPDTPSDFRFGM